MRRALGGSPWQVARAPLIEALLLSALGAGLGAELAMWGVPALRAVAGDALPRVFAPAVNARALAAAIVGAFIAAVVTGLAPAIQAMRQSPAGLVNNLRGNRLGHRAGTNALLVGQLALTVTLLAGAGVLIHSFGRLIHVELGFDPTPVVAADLRLSAFRHSYPDGRRDIVARLGQELRTIPGIRSASVATGIPFGGGTLTTEVASDVPVLAGAGNAMAFVNGITPGYFRTLGIAVERGGDQFLTGRADGLVIDSAAARTYFPGVDPLGRTLTLFPRNPGRIAGPVVGIVADVRDRLQSAPTPHIYVAYNADPELYLHVVAGGTAGEAATVAAIREAVRRTDPMIPIDRVGPMTDRVEATVQRERFYAILITLFAVAAVVLAGSGLYGAASFLANQRTREIGVRMALGATAAGVVRLIVSEGVGVCILGAALGLVGASAGARLIRAQLFETSPADPIALIASVGLLMIVAAVAMYAPARRATRVDPLIALRHE